MQSKSNGVAYFLLSLLESLRELPLSGWHIRLTSSTANSRRVCLSGCQYQESHDGINININGNRNSHRNVQIFYEVYSLCQTLTHHNAPWATSYGFDHIRSNPIKFTRWGSLAGDGADFGTKLSFCFWTTNSANRQHVLCSMWLQLLPKVHTPTHTHKVWKHKKSIDRRHNEAGEGDALPCLGPRPKGAAWYIL